jgi:hypothetical protein
MPGDKPDLEHGIYRVLHSIIIGNVRHMVENDFIFQDDRLLLVLEWGGLKENQHPALTLPLDPAYLEERPGMPGYFLYNGQLIDPRSPH